MHSFNIRHHTIQSSHNTMLYQPRIIPYHITPYHYHTGLTSYHTIPYHTTPPCHTIPTLVVESCRFITTTPFFSGFLVNVNWSSLSKLQSRKLSLKIYSTTTDKICFSVCTYNHHKDSQTNHTARRIRRNDTYLTHSISLTISLSHIYDVITPGLCVLHF